MFVLTRITSALTLYIDPIRPQTDAQKGPSPEKNEKSTPAPGFPENDAKIISIHRKKMSPSLALKNWIAHTLYRNSVKNQKKKGQIRKGTIFDEKAE